MDEFYYTPLVSKKNDKVRYWAFVSSTRMSGYAHDFYPNELHHKQGISGICLGTFDTREEAESCIERELKKRADHLNGLKR